MKLKTSPHGAPGPAVRLLAWACVFALAWPISVVTAPRAHGQAINPFPNALSDVPLLDPPGINQIGNVLNPEPPPINGMGGIAAARAWAIALGKVFLWDVQVGSDGQTACASCHFRAGTDQRLKNTLHPGANGAFNVVYRNGADPADPNHGRVITPASGLPLTGYEFPFHQRDFPELQNSAIIQNYDDAAGSQGIQRRNFVDLVPGNPVELGTPVNDPVFGANRQITRRNAPSYINAAYNFTQFHDGRANNVFNGVNELGALDQNAFVIQAGADGTLANGVPQLLGGPVIAASPSFVKFRLRMASLASQATVPPVSSVEMSYQGRTWPKIGKKLLSLKPLALQKVHPNDSVFGPPNSFYQHATLGTLPLGLNKVNPDPGGKGLAPDITYAQLIKNAFHPKFWKNVEAAAPKKITYATQVVNGVPVTVPTIAPGPPVGTGEFNQMEANFALFFGIALQLYQMTLISDQTTFDLFQKGQANFTPAEANGAVDFQDFGCAACHILPEFTSHAQRPILGGAFNPAANPDTNPLAAIGFENQGKATGLSFVDEGIYNIAVRPTAEDIGRGASTPVLDTRKKPAMANRTFPISFTLLAQLKKAGKLDTYGDLKEYVPDLPNVNIKRTDMVRGAFKVPNLRNIDITGAYLHNGSVLTLAQIMDFYSRGANFPKENAKMLHPAVLAMQQFAQTNADRLGDIHQNMVAFLKTLTDERVAEDAAPFDHPEIPVPNWVDPDGGTIAAGPFAGFGLVPAVGAAGRTAQGLQPIGVMFNEIGADLVPPVADIQFVDPFVPFP